MILEEKLREIAMKLAEKTRSRQVAWLPHEENERTVVVAFPHSGIRLSRVVEKFAATDTFKLTLTNDEGIPVASILIEESDSDWGIINQMYNTAFREATRWDAAVEDVEAALNVAGLVGIDV